MTVAALFKRGRRLVGAGVNVPLYHALFPQRRVPDRPAYQLGIFKPDGLGDFVLAIGAIRTLVDHYGPSQCVLIVSPLARNLAEILFPGVALAVVTPFSGRLWRSWSILRRLRSTPLFQKGVSDLVSLRHHRYLHQDLLLASIPSRRSFGLQNPPPAFDWEGCGSRLRFDFEGDWPVEIREDWCLELECHHALLRLVPGLAAVPSDCVPTIPNPRSGSREPWMVVAPYGSHALKDLPLEMVASLGRHVARRHGMSLRLLSAPSQFARLSSDADTLRRLGVPKVEVLLTRDMSDLMAAIGGAGLLLSTDTGTAHIGAAMDAPMIGLIGGAHYGIFAPWRRSKRQRWLNHRLPCYGCNWNCIHPRALCIQDVPPEATRTAADEILARDEAVARPERPAPSASSVKAEPFFSIVSVVFNDRAGIERTHQSVQLQSCQDFEWIVVDGASKDGTVDYIRGIAATRPRWISEPDRGIYDAMNKGTALATGRYVVYMNGGDCFADADCLHDVRTALESAGNPDLCYAGCHYRFEDGSVRDRPPRRLESSIRHGIPAVHQASFFRRGALDEPPYDLRYRISSDYYISARCYLKGATACYLNRPVAEFGVGGNSMKHSRVSLVECWNLQRDVLKLSLPVRCWSAARRYLAHRVLEFLHRRHAARPSGTPAP